MGRPPVITREKAAETALRIIDEDGLEALSLERLAKAIGVRGPSLYHHFADKSAILAEVAALVVGDLALIDRGAMSWDDWLVDISLGFYRRVMEHPRAAAVLIQYLPERSAVPGFGRAARKLTESGVDPSLQLVLMEGCEMLAWGWAIQRATLAESGTPRLPTSRFAKRWPELATAVRESRWAEEQLLEAALRAFIAGVLASADPATRTRSTRRTTSDPRPQAARHRVTARAGQRR